MKNLLPLLFLVAGSAQAEVRLVDVYSVTINGVPYSENMVLPSAGKDASGNYTLNVSFALRGVGFGSGEHVFAMSDTVCTGNYPNEREADSTPKVVLNDPATCKKFFTWSWIPFSNGTGAFALSAPDAKTGLYSATYSVSPTAAGSPIKLSHQWATFTSSSTVPGVTSAVGTVSTGCTYVPSATNNVAPQCNSTGKSNVFTVAGFGTAISGLAAKYTTSATGTLKSRVVTSKIRVDSTNFDQTGNLYVAAWIPAVSQLYFLTSTGWSVWDGVNYPAYKENVTLTENDLGTLVSGYNLRSLVGAKLYVGFGKNAQELIQKGQFSMIHELVMEQADRDEMAAEEAALAATVAAQKAKYDSCVTNGCDVGSPSTYIVKPQYSLSYGKFLWAGSYAVWECTYPAICPIIGKSIYAYNTTTGYWE